MGCLMSRRKKIQKRMNELNISQRQLAQYVMLSYNTITLWLDNKTTIPYRNLVRMATLLDLEAEDLLDVL